MKKLALICAITIVALLSSCQSAKGKREKQIADSIKRADSIALVQAKQQHIADSIAKVQAAQKKVADSIAHQDSIKKHLIKPAKATKPAKPAPKKSHK